MQDHIVGPGRFASLVQQVVAVLVAAFALSFSAPLQAEQQFDEATMAELFQWAARLSRRKIDDSLEPPLTHPTPLDRIHELMCPEQPTRCRRVIAAYSIKSREIIYSESLSADEVLHRSFLVHEMVHFLQHRALGSLTNASCRNILRNEREAYAVQAAYLQMHGNYYPVGQELRMIRCPIQPTDGTSTGWREMSDSQPGI